jgi:hypothetical protein
VLVLTCPGGIGEQSRKLRKVAFRHVWICVSSWQEDVMARAWSLQTVTNLKFRELEKTLIEIFGCIPVDYKRVIKLDVRRGTPMVQPESALGTQEKGIVEIFGCMPHDKHVIDFDVDRKKKVIVTVVREEGDVFHRSVPCA